jgi:hypothetical protein
MVIHQYQYSDTVSTTNHTAIRLNLGLQYLNLCTFIKLWWHDRHDDGDYDDNNNNNNNNNDKPSGRVAVD